MKAAKCVRFLLDITRYIYMYIHYVYTIVMAVRYCSSDLIKKLSKACTYGADGRR